MVETPWRSAVIRSPKILRTPRSPTVPPRALRWLICLALGLLAGFSRAAADSPRNPEAVTHYDPDPAHLWNRLHAALLTRPDGQGKTLGRDALDPLFFPTTKRLLEGPTHTQAVQLLDAFLADGHKLVRDPVRRAVLQRDLWSVFDWAAHPFGNAYNSPIEIRSGPLQERLAQAIRKLAPSPAQADALPDNFAQAVQAREHPIAFNPEQPSAPFLPPDLFDPAGPWVGVTGPRELRSPLAGEHASVFAGRSVFLVFIRLPEGRQATLSYLDRLNAFPKPWRGPSREPNPEAPQFPTGTQVALVRRLLVVTDNGKPTPTPLTESVQIRTYRDILPLDQETARHAERAQGFVLWELRRADLFAGTSGGLRTIQGDELVPSPLTFFRGWTDPFEAREDVSHSHYRLDPAFRQCAACHFRGGIRGVNCYTQFGVTRTTPTTGLFPASFADVRTRAAEWKSGLKDWAELRRLAGW